MRGRKDVRDAENHHAHKNENSYPYTQRSRSTVRNPIQMMRLRLPLLLVLLLVSSSARATWFPFSEPRRTGPAAYDQAAPVIASNGIDYLTAWTTVAFSPTYAMHVYAARVNADGTVEGDIATLLDTDAQFAHGVSVTQGRDGYFVAWMSEKGMTAAILDSYGRVERRTTVAQDDPYHNGRTIAAWNGAVHIVVSGFAPTFSATLLDDNASVIASNIPIGDTHGDATSVAVVADSSGFLVLSTKREFSGDAYRDAIYGRYVSPGGATGDWFLIRTVASAVSAVTVIADGSRDVIAWSDQFGIWTMDFNPLTLMPGNARQLSPAGSARLTRILRWQDRLWLAFQPFFGPSVVMPLNSDGSPGTPVTIGDGYQPEIATNGSAILSVRSAKSYVIASNDVIGHFISPDASDFLVSKSQTDQQNGKLASDGANVLTVWDEQVGADRLIYAARFDARGLPLDGSGVQISAGGVNSDPAAAFNGHDWLIVWRHSDQANATSLAGRRLLANGTVIDTADIVLGTASYAVPRVTSDGSNWLVAWIAAVPGPSCGNFGSASRAVASRISASGVVLDPGGRVLEPGSRTDQSDVDVAWDGANYVAAWTEQCSGWHTPTYTSVTAASFPPDLARVDAFGVSGGATITANQLPRVVARSQRALVAWQNVIGPSITTSYRLIGPNTIPQRSGRSRAVGTPAVISSVEGALVGTSIDASGLFTIVTKKAIPWVADNPPGLFTATLNADGLQVATGFAGTVSPDDVLTGKIVLHAGQSWIAAGRFDVPAGAQRLWIRELD